MNKRAVVFYLSLIAGLVLIVFAWYAGSFVVYGSDSEPTDLVNAQTVIAATTTPKPEAFDGARAYLDVQTQVNMGPRIPGTDGHAQIREWMRKELESAGWTVEVQETERLGHPIYNYIAKRGEASPQFIIAAHYDSRMIADHDPLEKNQDEPVPGANDGASGVAILMELARTLPNDIPPTWLVFFDAEDNGRIEGWDWILGSRAFVEEIPIQLQAVVIVDMVGDADLNLYYEMNSDKAIRAEIWNTAAALGYGNAFIPTEKFSMTDDHTPFLQKGIPAVDIIDFDYPYWHTTEDTPDKVSVESLQAVGDTLWHWLVEQGEP